MSQARWQVRIGTAEEFFAVGGRTARAADRGEPIPGHYTLLFEDPAKLAAYIAARQQAHGPDLSDPPDPTELQ